MDFIEILQCFVHVSTAFSNCDKSTVHEIIYNPLCDPNIATIIENVPQEVVDALAKKFLV